LKDLRRKLVRRGIQASGNSIIRHRNLHVDLRSAALRTKRPTVLDRGSTLLARVLHVFEASAERSGEQGIEGSDHRAIGSLSHWIVFPYPITQ
jgi:hypothetical protein